MEKQLQGVNALVRQNLIHENKEQLQNNQIKLIKQIKDKKHTNVDKLEKKDISHQNTFPSKRADYLAAANQPKYQNQYPQVFTSKPLTYSQQISKHFTGLFPVTIESSSSIVKQNYIKKSQQKLQDIYSNLFEGSDFSELKIVKLNIDQIHALIKNQNFLLSAPTNKIVEALHFLTKLEGGLAFYDQRKSVLNAFFSLLGQIQNQKETTFLRNDDDQAQQPNKTRHVKYLLQNPTYLGTLIATAGRMKIKDQKLWNMLAPLLLKSSCDMSYLTMTIRALSNAVYGLCQASHASPVLLDFSQLLEQLEKPILIKLNQECERLDKMKQEMKRGNIAQIKKEIQELRKNIGRSLAQISKSYSQLQTGSRQFFQHFQRMVIQSVDYIGTQQIANIAFSFSKYLFVIDPSRLLGEILLPVCKKLHKFKPVELCLLLKSYCDKEIKKKVIQGYQVEFYKMLELSQKIIRMKHQQLNLNDLSQLYFCLIEHEYYKDLNDSNIKIFNYFQKILMSGLIKTTKSHHLRDLFHKFQDDEVSALFSQALRSKLRGRVMDLIMSKKLSFYDAKQILRNIEGKQMSEGKYHKFMELIKNYLCIK